MNTTKIFKSHEDFLKREDKKCKWRERRFLQPSILITKGKMKVMKGVGIVIRATHVTLANIHGCKL